MDVLVCVKACIDPESLGEPKIVNDKGIDLKNAVIRPNEWDRYAVEEAVRLVRESRSGGKVVVVSVGSEKAMDTIYEALGRGADEAIHIVCDDYLFLDPFITANLIYKSIIDKHFDIFLTGAQSADNSSSLTGAILSELLGIPYVWNVVRIELSNAKAIVYQELEANVRRALEIDLPAVFAIQTGITELRYVSFASLRSARNKMIRKLTIDDLKVDIDKLRKWNIKRYCIPKWEKTGKIISGEAEIVAKEFLKILKEELRIL